MGKLVCKAFFCLLGEDWEGESEMGHGPRERSHQNKGKFCVLCKFVQAGGPWPEQCHSELPEV